MFGKLTVYLSAAVVVAASAAHGAEPLELNGVLFRAVFQNETGVIGKQDKRSVSANVRAEVDAFSVRAGAFSSQLKCAEGDSAAECAKLSERQKIERAIVALIDREGIEAQAARFAGEIRLLTDWQGRSDGPIEEAASVRDRLGVDSSSPVVPFMHLLLAHRYRAAFEAAVQEKKTIVVAQAEALYRHALAQALQSGSRPVELAALDLDRQPFVYRDVHAKPAGAGGPPCGDGPTADPVPEPRAWLPACLLAEPGAAASGSKALHEFAMDIDHDGKPELFLGSQSERRGGVGPYHVFRGGENGYRQVGTVTIRPKFFKVLPLGTDGRPRVVRYLRSPKGDGVLDTLTLDETGFKIVSGEHLAMVAPGAERIRDMFERKSEEQPAK